MFLEWWTDPKSPDFTIAAMMAPERSGEATAAAVARSSGVAVESQPGSGLYEARAPLKWPFTSRAQQERALQRQADAARRAADSGTSSESDGDERTSNGGRETDEPVDSESGASKPSYPAPSQADQPVAEDEVPDEAEAVISKEWVAARFALIFVVGAAGPVASKQTDAVRAVTIRLAKLAWAHVQGLTPAQVDALSKSFGNFDRVVAAGWLLGDALGLPLMERTHALAVGLKAKYEAGKLDKKEAYWKKVVSRLPVADAKRQALEKDAQTDIEKLAQTEIEDLPLPTAAQPAAPRESGSRKRAREEEVELSHEDIVEVMNEGLLHARNWVKQAEAELALASRVTEGKSKVSARMARKLEEAVEKGKKKKNPEASVLLITRWQNAWQDAKEQYYLAAYDEAQAEVYLLSARLAASDAERDMYAARCELACQSDAAR